MLRHKNVTWGHRKPTKSKQKATNQWKRKKEKKNEETFIAPREQEKRHSSYNVHTQDQIHSFILLLDDKLKNGFAFFYVIKTLI